MFGIPKSFNCICCFLSLKVSCFFFFFFFPQMFRFFGMCLIFLLSCFKLSLVKLSYFYLVVFFSFDISFSGLCLIWIFLGFSC